MPFVASSGNRIVTPEEVSDEDKLYCIDCGQELGIRERHEREGRFVAKHFWHEDDSATCSGGESDVHRRLKSIALSKIKHKFSHQSAGLERTVGRNRADVFLIFEEKSSILGKGVIVEVQFRNYGKDTEAVTRNYLGEGFSVYWVDRSDFEQRDVRLGSEIRYWWGKEYKEGVLDIFYSIDTNYRFGNVGRDRLTYRDIEKDVDMPLERIVKICKSLADHSVIDLNNGKIKPIAASEDIDSSEKVRNRIRGAMADLI